MRQIVQLTVSVATGINWWLSTFVIFKLIIQTYYTGVAYRSLPEVSSHLMIMSLAFLRPQWKAFYNLKSWMTFQDLKIWKIWDFAKIPVTW